MRPPEPAAADGRIAPAVAPTGLAEQRELSWLPLRSPFSGAVLRAVSSKLSAHSCVDKIITINNKYYNYTAPYPNCPSVFVSQ